MQNLKVPSFFHASTTALHQGDWEGHIALPSSISWMCCCTSSTLCGTILLNLSLKGSSCSGSSSMMCSVASVQPISFLSRLKMWWNSIRSCLALRAVSFFQLSNFPRLPFSSNTFIRSSWCCSVVNGVSGSLSLASMPPTPVKPLHPVPCLLLLCSQPAAGCEVHRFSSAVT